MSFWAISSDRGSAWVRLGLGRPVGSCRVLLAACQNFLAQCQKSYDNVGGSVGWLAGCQCDWQGANKDISMGEAWTVMEMRAVRNSFIFPMILTMRKPT